MDPAKLKVVELRAELAARGLDQKGVKAILVSRLQAALDQEQQNLTTAIIDDNSSSVEQEPSVTDVYPPQEQQHFEVQTEPPTLPVPSAQYDDIDDKSEEAADKSQPPIQQSEQDNLPAFANQSEVVDEESEEASASSRSSNSEHDNESNIEENLYQQFDEPSAPAPPQQQHNTDDAVQMETAEPQNEYINENVDAQHEPAEPMESEPAESTAAPEVNEPVQSEAPQPEAPAELGGGDEQSKEDQEMKEFSAEVDKDKQQSTSDKESEKNENRKRRRSRSKSKSPPAKRANRRASPARNTDDFTNEEDEPEFDENAVLLSWYDSDLNLAINKPELCSARPLSDGALALAWAGARATYGVNSGKVCYEVQVNEINRVQNLSEERNLYELRCGWSILSENLQLGESAQSYGYSGCAKKASDTVFSDYGIKYGSRGDVVGVYLDMDSSPCTIQYTVNGEPQGVAFEFEKEDLNGASLYPHILTKNLAFTVNFGQCAKLLVNEERPNRARRDERERESSRRESNRRNKDSSEKEKRKSESESHNDVKSEEKSDVKSEEKSEEKSDENPEEKSVENPEEKPEETAETKQEENLESDENATKEEKDEKDEKDENVENGDADGEKPNEVQQKEHALLAGYELIGNIGVEHLVQGYQRPKTRNECEVILLIGLPKAGKTHWANQHSKENVEKHYNILGVQNLLNKMTVCGEARKKHHSHGRWDRFIDWATRALHSIQDIAVKKRRNYILDQPNVLASAQRRKMKGYGDFKRIAAVIIPDEDTYKERCEKEEKPADNVINEMKANYTLPDTEVGWFDEVIYTELNEEEAKKKVQEFNEKGKKAQKERERDNDRNDRRRDDNRDRYGRDRRNWGQSSDRRWRHQQTSSSQWHNRGVGSSGNSGRSRDKWHGSSGGGSSNWGNRRYDYPNRDRRHDDRRGSSRSDRDYKDSRDKRGGGGGGGGDKHGSKRDKDNHSSSRSSYSSKGSSSQWNSNKSYNRPQQSMSSNRSDYGSFGQMSSSQQSSNNWAAATSGYTAQQQQWLQWQQQGPIMQATQNQSQQQHQQANNSQWWQPQQQQATGNHQGWQNWAQYAQAYGVNTNSNGANLAKK